METKEQALAYLRESVQRDETVYTVIHHTARSGAAVIGLFVIHDNKPVKIAHLASRVLGLKYDRDHGGVWADTNGMDRGFEIVYSLAHAVFGDGYALDHRWL